MFIFLYELNFAILLLLLLLLLLLFFVRGGHSQIPLFYDMCASGVSKQILTLYERRRCYQYSIRNCLGTPDAYVRPKFLYFF